MTDAQLRELFEKVSSIQQLRQTLNAKTFQGGLTKIDIEYFELTEEEQLIDYIKLLSEVL